MKFRLLFASAAIAAMSLTTLDTGGFSFGTDAHAGGGKGGGQGAGGPGGEGGPGNSGGAGNSGNAGQGAGQSAANGTQTGPGAHGHGMATAAAAVDPSTKGLTKAAAVVGTTPANPQALESITANQERQAARQDDTTEGTTEGTTGEDSDMSLGEAVNNMSRDVRSALSELFGSRAAPTTE